MHVRINIPAWGCREYAYSLLSVLPFKTRTYTERLTKKVRKEADGRYVYLLSSGRFCIVSAIQQLGLTHPRVAVPAYVCPSVIQAIRQSQAEPVLIDVEAGSIQFDADRLKQNISDSLIDAIVAPNTYGLSQDYACLSTLNVPWIEDAAYQAGVIDDVSKRVCGLRGTAGVWSFNFKALTSVGGGVLLSREKINALETLKHPRIGPAITGRFVNYLFRSIFRTHIPVFFPGAELPQPYDLKTIRRAFMQVSAGLMSELQAAIALTQWQKREAIYAAQRRNSQIVLSAVNQSPILRLLKGQETTVMAHLFPVLLDVPKPYLADAVLRFRRILYEHSIQTETPYPVACESFTAVPNAYKLASRLILVPCNASLNEKQMKHIARTIEIASQAISRMTEHRKDNNEE